ncbi:MAG: SDR family oxidoreductase [Spirochaetaceae bacterium]|nr:MAG: SDR family oxidoreductase [Spirochaetaceae bacterium]
MAIENPVCLISGAAGGIGRACAERLAREGGRVVAVDRSATGSDDLVDQLGGRSRALFVQADLTNSAEIGRAVGAAVDRFGGIDVLVNCIGVASLTRVPDVTEQEWDTIFSVNLRSVFFLSQHVLTHMVPRRSGTIITISSASAKIGGVAVGPHYSASKAGIICLTKSLALYGAPYGITANCVCPGPTETPMTDAWGDALNREFAARIPLGRYATAAEVAHAVCFLASGDARYVTGEIVDVNGGLVMD